MEREDVKDQMRAQGLRMADTEEELREVMRRWVEGIKDDHDLVVDRLKAKVRSDVEKLKEQGLEVDSHLKLIARSSDAGALRVDEEGNLYCHFSSEDQR